MTSLVVFRVYATRDLVLKDRMLPRPALTFLRKNPHRARVHSYVCNSVRP